MFGWLRAEIARASRSNLSLAVGLSDRWAGRILTATVRSRRVSRARYTSPMPPAPSGARISYGPRREPGDSTPRSYLDSAGCFGGDAEHVQDPRHHALD